LPEVGRRLPVVEATGGEEPGGGNSMRHMASQAAPPKQCPPRICNPALVRVFRRIKHRRRLVCLAVKVGTPQSEERLTLMLESRGTKEMATDFLNPGSSLLMLRCLPVPTLCGNRGGG
jgi:hypothetical protein